MYGVGVARTRDPAVHALRRDEFVDTAIALMQVKGWSSTSIQDVLDDVGASKGAFYHYFGSKADLLEAVIDRITTVATDSIRPMVQDPALTSLEKLHGLFAGIARWKGERTDLMLAVVEAWEADDNAIVREKFRRGAVGLMAPLLADIIRQGRTEGRFEGLDPDEAGHVLASYLLGANEAAVQLYTARRADTITFEAVQRRFAAYAQGLERYLGLSAGSLAIVDPDVLRQWFG
jgi:AcrR family transcriptional regulator